MELLCMSALSSAQWCRPRSQAVMGQQSAPSEHRRCPFSLEAFLPAQCTNPFQEPAEARGAMGETGSQERESSRLPDAHLF